MQRPAEPHQTGATVSPGNLYLFVTKQFPDVGMDSAFIRVSSSVVPADQRGTLTGVTMMENEMKFFRRTWFIYMTLILAGAANAEWSGNIGWASDYFYRGIFQASSSANGGIDIEKGGFFAGTWVADVGEGLEVDGYFGYGGELGNFSYGIGLTGYYYTQDFDDTYEEINLSAGYGIATVDVAVGRYDNFGSGRQDYTFYSLTLEKEGFYGKYAGFAQNFAGEYFEFGYSATLAEVDLGLSIILANEELVGQSEESLVFTVGKSFDF